MRVIGGLWVEPKIRDLSKTADGPTLQEAFASGSYDFDYVWPKPARALAKQIFVLCYLLLTVSGTTALAAAAMLLDLRE